MHMGEGVTHRAPLSAGCWARSFRSVGSWCAHKATLQSRQCIHVTHLETEALRSCGSLEESPLERGSTWMEMQA